MSCLPPLAIYGDWEILEKQITKNRPVPAKIEVKLADELFEMVKEKIELPDHITKLDLHFGLHEPLTATATFYAVRKQDEH